MRVGLVAGASGLVGGECLRVLLERDEFASVIVVARKKLQLSHPKLEQRMINYNRLLPADVVGATDVFCALGASVVAQKDQLRKVDLEYVTALAGAAKQAGARRFCLVTSVATDAKSSLSYLKIKAEAEAVVAGLGFEACYFARPAFVAGGGGFIKRTAALLSLLTTPLLIGPLGIYRRIHARDLAEGLVGAAIHGQPGVHILHRDELLASALPPERQ